MPGLGLEPALGLELGLEPGLGLEPALGLVLGLEPAPELGLGPVQGLVQHKQSSPRLTTILTGLIIFSFSSENSSI